MATVDYEARRELVPDHLEGSNYSFSFDISDLQRPSGGDLKSTTKSLDGTMETLYFGREKIWRVTTEPVQVYSSLAALLYEFLGSTADGQQFTFDPYDDSEGFLVSRDDDGFTETLFSQIDGVNDYVQFVFQVREV